MRGRHPSHFMWHALLLVLVTSVLLLWQAIRSTEEILYERGTLHFAVTGLLPDETAGIHFAGGPYKVSVTADVGAAKPSSLGRKLIPEGTYSYGVLSVDGEPSFCEPFFFSLESPAGDAYLSYDIKTCTGKLSF